MLPHRHPSAIIGNATETQSTVPHLTRERPPNEEEAVVTHTPQDEATPRLLEPVPGRDLSRRELMRRVAAGAGLAGLATLPLGDRAAKAAVPAASAVTDPAQVQRLIALSQTLCGGGRFDPNRAAALLQLLDADPGLKRGLAELLTPPPATPAAPSANAQATEEAILLYWYVGTFGGKPVPDRATAYYTLTAWQAMYAPPYAVCKAFGAWSDPPKIG